MLVVFEGIDGSGKTTLINSLLEELIDLNLEAVKFFEPTAMEWGKQIREIFQEGRRLAPKAELKLFMKDRADNVEKQIKPALKEGKIVLQDRYYFSSAAYQGAEGLDWKEIIDNNEKFCVKPDLVFFLDLTPEEALARIEAEGRKKTAPEKEETLTRIDAVFREMFLRLSDKKKYEIIFLDATKTREELIKDVIKYLSLLIRSPKINLKGLSPT